MAEEFETTESETAEETQAVTPVLQDVDGNERTGQSEGAAVYSRVPENFEVRMCEAGYTAGRRYDALKNAFLSYRGVKNPARRIIPRITRNGETFAVGKKTIGKITVVRGNLRLFLGLDPAEFNPNKYHHKDYTGVARYANYPLMIRLTSDRQTKNALELIDAVMQKYGFEPDPDYQEEDRAQIFAGAKRRPFESPAVPDPAEGSKSYSRVPESFSVRMGEAGYVTGRKYDALKNAFLSYRGVKNPARRVIPRITRSGETFAVGKKTVAKITVVRGNLRLFLELDPKEFNKNKYHQKDYTGVAKYLNYPFMIRISSDRQMKNALELIAVVMANYGFEPDPDYREKDQAHIFVRFIRKRTSAAAAGATNNADAATVLPPEEGEDDAVADSAEEEYSDDEEAMLREIAAAEAEPAEEDDDGDEEDEPEEPAEAAEEPVEELVEVPVEEPEEPAEPAEECAEQPVEEPNPIDPIDVRLPKRATVVNKKGEKIGKVRKSVWYDLTDDEKKAVGTFVKEEKNVYLYHESACRGYVDKNNNVLAKDSEYLATVRYTPWRFLLVIVALLLVIVALASSLIAAYYMMPTTDYAPVLFIADAYGTSWDEEKNLSVFFNEKFGDTVIEPGMSGSYRFTFRNDNADALEYGIAFGCKNPFKIGLGYRLKRDGAYIAGSDGYVSAEDLSTAGLTVEAKSTSLFELEWYWQDNDQTDTAAGEGSAQYTLTISLTAWVSGS